MEDYAYRFWWLIFPVMWFILAGFRRITRYHEHRATLDMMRTLAAQGKDPAEVMKAMGPAYPGYYGYRGYRR